MLQQQTGNGQTPVKTWVYLGWDVYATRCSDVTYRWASSASACSSEHERALVARRWSRTEMESRARRSGAVDTAVHRRVSHCWSVGSTHRSCRQHIAHLENRFTWRHLPVPRAPGRRRSRFYVRPQSSEFRRQTSTRRFVDGLDAFEFHCSERVEAKLSLVDTHQILISCAIYYRISWRQLNSSHCD